MNNTTQQPTAEQQAKLLAYIREQAAKRERFEKTRVGCSAWHIMVKGTRR